MTKTKVACSLRAIPLPSRVVLKSKPQDFSICLHEKHSVIRVTLSKAFPGGGVGEDVDTFGYCRWPVRLDDEYERRWAFSREYRTRERVFLILFVWYEGRTMEEIRRGTGLTQQEAGGGYGALNTLIAISKRQTREGLVRRLPEDLGPARANLDVRRYSVLDLLLNGPNQLASAAAMKIRDRAGRRPW